MKTRKTTATEDETLEEMEIMEDIESSKQIAIELKKMIKKDGLLEESKH